METPFITIALTEFFGYIVVFARFAGFFAFAPIFSERRVSPQLRILIGLLITLIVTPVVQKTLPDMPASAFEFNLIVVIQFLIGSFAALIAQVLLSALDVAGSIISFQMGLANAFVASAATQQQTGLPSLLLLMTATLLMLATDFHHVFILLITESFHIFPPKDLMTSPNIFADQGAMYLRFLSAAFLLSLQISAPIIILGLLMFFAAGVMNRLLPSIQVFFILQPLQILLGFVILFSGITIILGHYIEDFGDKYQAIWNTR